MQAGAPQKKAKPMYQSWHLLNIYIIWYTSQVQNDIIRKYKITLTKGSMLSRSELASYFLLGF